jgi:ATP-dependent Clp protease protease subunit
MKSEAIVYEQPGKLLTDNAILLLTRGFDQENIMPLVARIMEYNLLPVELQPKYITLVINSPGGSVHSAYHLIDVMKSSKIPVHTVGMGLVASCGVLTLMAGAKGHRKVTQNTSTMSHTYSWGSGGKEHELYAIQKEFELSSERMLSHYKKCTGKSEKYIRKHLLSPQDDWLTPEEVVKHGIADSVTETY